MQTAAMPECQYPHVQMPNCMSKRIFLLNFSQIISTNTFLLYFHFYIYLLHVHFQIFINIHKCFEQRISTFPTMYNNTLCYGQARVWQLSKVRSKMSRSGYQTRPRPPIQPPPNLNNGAPPHNVDYKKKLTRLKNKIKALVFVSVITFTSVNIRLVLILSLSLIFCLLCNRKMPPFVMKWLKYKII